MSTDEMGSHEPVSCLRVPADLLLRSLQRVPSNLTISHLMTKLLNDKPS